MKILVACEVSGKVRNAFLAQGHTAVSCDLVDSWTPGPHIKDDVLNHLKDGWDMMVAFPPCTYLARSGSRHWWNTEEMGEALDFVNILMQAPISKIAIENPIGAISTYIKKPTQIVQPWMFGHGECKATCLWLKNLPRLKPTNVVEGRIERIHNLSQSWYRPILASITYDGIAEAMAAQWGSKIVDSGSLYPTGSQITDSQPLAVSLEG